jgi:hypothetical protein
VVARQKGNIVIKIRTDGTHDYYAGPGQYNIVPKDFPPPEGWYHHASYILAIKGKGRFAYEEDAVKFFMEGTTPGPVPVQKK